MTKEQTRQLGIEFERRLFEIYPQFATTEKLDTDTIYSFLSEFQSQYVRSLYAVEMNCSVVLGKLNEYMILLNL